MITAYILVQAEVGRGASVGKEVAAIKHVKLADVVTGPYDVIASAEAENMDELGGLVVAKIQAVDGVTGPGRAHALVRRRAARSHRAR